MMFAAVGQLSANDGYYLDNPELAQAFVRENPNVRMLSEIVVYRNNWFTTVFTFTNLTRQPQTVKLGFPVNANYLQNFGDMPVNGTWAETIIPSESALTPEAKIRAVTEYFKFESSANGTALERTPVINSGRNDRTPMNGRYDVIFVGEINFAPSQRVVVTNRYFQKPDHGVYSAAIEENFVNYILKTGASWAHTIGDAKIVIYIPKTPFYKYYESLGSRMFYLKTSGGAPLILQNYSEYVVYYHFRNYEPREDIKVEFGYTGYYNSYASPDANFYDSAVYAVTNRANYSSATGLNEYIGYYQNRDIFTEMLKSLANYNISNFKLMQTETVPAWIQGYAYLAPYRFVINSYYALYGYKFSNEAWLAFFKKFEWYRPTTTEPGFSAADRRIIDALQANERVSR